MVLASCARPNAPAYNLWLGPGQHDVMGAAIEVAGDQTVIRDPDCGVFVLRDRKELGSPGYAYQYTSVIATDLTPTCAIAAEAHMVQVGSSVEDDIDRRRYPLGGRMSYVLHAGTCMPGQGCETLLGRYFEQGEPSVTVNYREIARRGNERMP